jgi:hypothetical protein
VQGVSIQGWKLHICIHPDDVKELFELISPTLKNEQVFHKFYPFTAYAEAGYGRQAQLDYDAAPGKACVIYPLDPKHLAEIIKSLDEEVIAARSNRADGETLRPYPTGVTGDLALGRSGLMYVRYGGFSGPLAIAHKLYDPLTGSEVPDPRHTRPFPDFIKALPLELVGLRRSTEPHLR